MAKAKASADEKERASVEELAGLAEASSSGDLDAIREAMTLATAVFRSCLKRAGHNPTPLLTKFRDAGRRSAPWRPTSSRVPGRPQDGRDGNRIARWLLPTDHKFYADEATATLVELRYLFQCLSMQNAPPILDVDELAAWEWLTEGPIGQGNYLDPVQLIPIDFIEVLSEPRIVTSGHLTPLDRGGKHEPSNTFLTLKVSNDLQGNLTVSELLQVLHEIVQAHMRLRGWKPNH